MKLRKFLAAATTAVVTAASMSVFASAAPSFTRLAEGEAMLGFGDADWKASGWGKDESSLDMSYFTTAQITGNGVYTVGIDLSAGYENLAGIEDEDTGELVNYTTANGIGAMGINVCFDADDDTYDNFGINITSVKFDGVESIKAGAVSYTNNEDGGKRCNVFNQWANYDASKEDHITSDPDAATSLMTDFAGEWTTCEVTFEVFGLDEAAAPAPVEDNTPADNAAADNTPAAAPAATDSKGSPDTGVEGIAAVAGLAVVAGGALAIAKKRK